MYIQELQTIPQFKEIQWKAVLETYLHGKNYMIHNTLKHNI